MDKKSSYDVSVEIPLFNRIGRAIGYIFCGFGLVFLILILVTTLEMRNNPLVQLYPELYNTLLLASIEPWVIMASLSFVVGAVGLYIGRNKAIPSYKIATHQTNETNLLERLNRLEEVIDNNFSFISKRLDSIEEKQKLASQNTLIKAKEE
jgi:hypothetical protein